MTVLSQSASADINGEATVTISPQKSGIQWAVAQSSVETRPYRGTAQCETRFNENFLTSSAVLPATAGGAPAITLQANDNLSFRFTGCTQGDSCVVTIYYTESPWGTIPRVDVV